MGDIVFLLLFFLVYGGFCLWHAWSCFSEIRGYAEDVRTSGEYKTLIAMIDRGDWVYSADRLEAEVGSYAYSCWLKDHPFAFLFVILLWMPIGLIPGIIMAAAIYLNGLNAYKYDEHLAMLKGLERNTSPAPTQQAREYADNDDVAGEVDRLFALRQKGALSEDEYADLKAKALKRA